MLVMQDVQLGLIIAMLPALARHVEKQYDPNSDGSTDILSILGLLMEILVSLILVLFVSVIIGKYFIQHIMRILSYQPKEIQMLGSAGLMYLMLLFTNYLGLSMELGCFLAGIVIAISAQNYAEQVAKILEPLKDMFGTFFFTTIGFHVFPSFVSYEITVLITLTVVIVTLKFCVGAVVMKAILPVGNQSVKWIICSGLAQVSEFSFVQKSLKFRSNFLAAAPVV